LRDEAATTEYLGYLAPGRTLLGLWTALRRPVRSVAAAVLCVRYLVAHRRDARVLLLTLAILPKLLAMIRRIQELDARRIHAHFANLPAFAGMIAAEVLGIPFSFTGHAWDLHVGENRAGLPLKVSRATFVSTCTAHNVEFLRGLCPASADKIMLHHHGLDLEAVARVRPLPPAPPGEAPFLAGGRLVPQKGLAILLAAWRELLDRGVEATCEIVGTGPLHDQLESEITRLRLAAHVRLVGSMPNEELLARLASCRGFVLPCVRTPDGFMDGIPNILAEAMALGRPVVSTRLSGVPELVEDGVSGLLAEPGDPGSLADHLERLIRDPALAGRLGAAGRRQIAAMFDLRTNVADLALRLTTEAAGGHEVGSPRARTRAAVLRSAAPIAGGGVDRTRTGAGGSAEGRRCVARP
jgi:glycosyltransferase involved in cell wall biosynthesis